MKARKSAGARQRTEVTRRTSGKPSTVGATINGWVDVPPNGNAGVLSEPTWFRVDLVSEASRTVLVRLNEFSPREVTLVHVVDGRAAHSRTARADEPSSARDVADPSFIFRLQLPEGDSTLLLRMVSHEPVQLRLTAESEEHLATTLGRQLATRIKHLPPGTVKFDNVIAQNILGSEENMMSAGSGSPPSAVLDDCQNNNLEDMDVNDLDMNLINVDIYDYMDHFKNKNTKRNEDNAINAFDRTMEKINKIKGTKFKSFKDASEEELSEQICEYFKVAKKRNGQYYNAASLTTLMGCFSRVLRNRRVNPIETKDNPKFKHCTHHVFRASLAP